MTNTKLLPLAFAVIMCLSASSLISQFDIVFFDRTDLLSNKKVDGQICRAFADLNGDYRDDLIRLDGLNNLMADMQSDNGANFRNFDLGKFPGDSWTIGVGDLDNNGINEIMTSGFYNGMSIWKSPDHKLNYKISQVSEPDFFSQASNFVDINNDGFLDIFICNDDDESIIFINDGSGKMIKDLNVIDMKTTVPSDNSGNYSSVWTDVDDDGDLDLYIGKCRLGVTDENDPRRLNALFINENGNFVESAAAFGLDIRAQTWTVNFGDIDNDGDQDAFMINHDSPYLLLENIGNQSFVEIPLLSDGTPLLAYGLQSAMADFNNDGYLDILVSGDKDYLLLNDKKKSFVSTRYPFGLDISQTFALGDANEDGFTDVLAGFNSFGSYTKDYDKLFLNSTNDNHYVSISLKGMQSNKNGIGSKLMIYGGWGKQTRIIKSGVGYGITNSLTARFGLGEFSSIDSLIIHWPSGIVDKYTNLIIDDHLLATEDICITPLPNIEALNPPHIDCLNTSVALRIEAIQNTIQWSNGDMVDSIILIEPDIINAVVQSDDFCAAPSQFISISSLDPLNIPQLNILNDIVVCEPKNIVLSTISDEDFSWSNGSTASQILLINPGSYYAINSNICDTVISEKIQLDIINPSDIGKDSTIVLAKADKVELNSGHSSTLWYSDINGRNEISSGPTLLLDTIRRDTSLYYSFLIPQTGPSYLTGASIDETLVQSNINIPNFEIYMFFSVEKTINFSGITVNALKRGNRKFDIHSIDNNELVFSITKDLDQGISEVSFNVILEPGQYQLSTDATVNLNVFSSQSPQLFAFNNSGDFPYIIKDVLTIFSSNFGESLYPYFFDWRIEPVLEDCFSDIFAFNIDYDPISSTQDVEDYLIKIFPNPVLDMLKIESSNRMDNLTIYDISGRPIQFIDVQNSSIQLDISTLEKGTYLIELSIQDSKIIKKIIVL